MSSKITRLLISRLSIVLLLGLFSCNQQNAWQEAKNVNNIASYENYLAHYPNGKKADSALCVIEELYFDNAKSTNSIISFENYLKKYPSGKFVDSTMNLLDTLYFVIALNLNTIEEYQIFIDKHPESKFVNLAKEKIEVLNRMVNIVDIFFPEKIRIEDYNQFGRQEYDSYCEDGEHLIGLKLAINAKKINIKPDTYILDVFKIYTKGDDDFIYYYVSFDGKLYNRSYGLTFLEDFKYNEVYIVIKLLKSYKSFVLKTKNKEVIPFRI